MGKSGIPNFIPHCSATLRSGGKVGDSPLSADAAKWGKGWGKLGKVTSSAIIESFPPLVREENANHPPHLDFRLALIINIGI